MDLKKTSFNYTGGPVNDDGTPIFNFNSNEVANRNWWKIGLAVVAGFLSGGIVGGIVAGINAYTAEKTTDISKLLPGEYDTIINWFKTDFTNYFNGIIIEGNSLLADNFSASSLPELNELQKKLCVMKNFYSEINSDTSISDNAINFRYELIEPYITAVENLLKAKAETLSAKATSISINVANYDMRPLFMQQPHNILCSISRIGQSNIATVPMQTATSPVAEKKSDLSWLWFALATGAFVLVLRNSSDE